MGVQINHNDVKLNKAQKAALELLVSRLASKDRQTAGHDNEVVITFDLQPTDYGVVWVRVKQDIPALPETNALRCYYQMDNHWFVNIGKLGALTAHMAPKSIHQFKGKRWCGINIRKDVS